MPLTKPENVPFWVERYDRLSELETRQFLAKKVLLDQNAVSPKYKNYDEKDIIGLQQRMVLKSLITGYKKDGEMLKSKDVDKVALKQNIKPQVLLPKTTQLTYANLGARLDPITLSNLTEVYEKTYPDKGVIEMGRIMKPVGPETSKIIMDEGALSYLKARLKHAPNEKYYFPACSSWEYNWKPDECKIAGYPNNFAKVARLQRSLSQPNPIKVDPKHYRQPFKQRDKRG